MGLARASATRSHFLEISQKPMWEAPRSHVGKLPEAVLESSQKPCWKAPRSHFGKLPETCWPKGSCGLVIVLSSVCRVGPHVGDFVRAYSLVCVVHNVVFSAPISLFYAKYVSTFWFTSGLRVASHSESNCFRDSRAEAETHTDTCESKQCSNLSVDNDHGFAQEGIVCQMDLAIPCR